MLYLEDYLESKFWFHCAFRGKYLLPQTFRDLARFSRNYFLFFVFFPHSDVLYLDIIQQNVLLHIFFTLSFHIVFWSSFSRGLIEMRSVWRIPMSTTVGSPRVKHIVIHFPRSRNRLFFFKDDIKHFLPSDETLFTSPSDRTPAEWPEGQVHRDERNRPGCGEHCRQSGGQVSSWGLCKPLTEAVQNNFNRWNVKKIKQFVKSPDIVRYQPLPAANSSF